MTGLRIPPVTGQAVAVQGGDDQERAVKVAGVGLDVDHLRHADSQAREAGQQPGVRGEVLPGFLGDPEVADCVIGTDPVHSEEPVR